MGNVFSALLSWLSVKSRGGKWLLRIEDIDPQRSKQHYAEQIMEDLEWLGLTWDEGPYYQSQRSDIYGHYLNELSKQGLLYPSYKTRAERLAVSAPQEDSPLRASNPTSPTPRSLTPNPSPWRRGEELHNASEEDSYKQVQNKSQKEIDKESTKQGKHIAPSPLRGGQGEGLSLGVGVALHVSPTVITYTDRHYGEQQVDMKRDIGDFIVRRRDGAWAYQLAVVVDDALMGVTEVVRGRDLLQSAGQQIYLGGLLGFPRMDYAHLPLLCNENGQRLSKRDKSMDLGALRQHFSAEEIIGKLAFFAHLIGENEPCKPADLLPLFDWKKVPCDDILLQSPEGSPVW